MEQRCFLYKCVFGVSANEMDFMHNIKAWFCILEGKRRFLHNLLNTSAKRTWCCPENKFVELYFHNNNYTIHTKIGRRSEGSPMQNLPLEKQ